jgi:hypothetical protein
MYGFSSEWRGMALKRKPQLRTVPYRYQHVTGVEIPPAAFYISLLVRLKSPNH